MNKKEFLELARLHTQAYDVKIVVHDSKYIKCDGLAVSGLFDNDNLKIEIAIKNPSWFEIFVHEYAHFRQWIEYCHFWKRFDTVVKRWDDWVVHKKEMSPERVKIEFKAVRDLELDCEKRSVELIKQFNLPIDIKSYIRKANSYIYFYAFVRDYRTWSQYAPYKVKKIVDLMSPRFLKTTDYNRPSEKYIELVKKNCLKMKRKKKRK